ncbi:MerR family transcriptional regulator [Halobacillus salinus]|uniref:MerR family transcriptional regulator n=1 Tax=Halobacillus salinus TaxID=192814 RepID=UPI0009A7095F|nr:MerR family transcriptional regulator [Halobacillus salinus]
MYTITEVARKLGIKPHTLRYYEREGIMESERTDSGVRRYTEQHIQWLRFVVKLRETHMPVSTIKQYVDYYKQGDHTAPERLKLIEEHLTAIHKQIEELQETEIMLKHKVSTYKDMMGTGTLSH